jgi:hypothetical protein
VSVWRNVAFNVFKVWNLKSPGKMQHNDTTSCFAYGLFNILTMFC